MASLVSRMEEWMEGENQNKKTYAQTLVQGEQFENLEEDETSSDEDEAKSSDKDEEIKHGEGQYQETKKDKKEDLSYTVEVDEKGRLNIVLGNETLVDI